MIQPPSHIAFGLAAPTRAPASPSWDDERLRTRAATLRLSSHHMIPYTVEMALTRHDESGPSLGVTIAVLPAAPRCTPPVAAHPVRIWHGYWIVGSTCSAPVPNFSQ
jgi:hypothetical protein